MRALSCAYASRTRAPSRPRISRNVNSPDTGSPNRTSYMRRTTRKRLGPCAANRAEPLPGQHSTISALDNGPRRCCQPPRSGRFPRLAQPTPPWLCGPGPHNGTTTNPAPETPSTASTIETAASNPLTTTTHNPSRRHRQTRQRRRPRLQHQQTYQPTRRKPTRREPPRQPKAFPQRRHNPIHDRTQSAHPQTTATPRKQDFPCPCGIPHHKHPHE